MSKETLLLITRNFPPLVGGMERLLLYTAEALVQNYRLHICAPAGGELDFSDYEKYYSLPHRPLWRFFLFSLFYSLVATWRSRPAVILAGSGLSAVQAYCCSYLLKLRGKKCQVVTYLHGLDIASADPLYRCLVFPFICRMDFVLVNSMATEKLAQQAGISHTKLLYPCVQLPAPISANDHFDAKIKFCQMLNLDSRVPLILAVGRLTARKGLQQFIENCLPEIIAQVANCQLIIIGDDANNAAQSSKTSQLQTLKKSVAQLSLKSQVHFLGQVNDQLLSLAYASCQVMIFPVQNRPNDPEGFGMVAIEAAAHDLPTVAFACGGVVEAVSHKQSGVLISPDDYQKFTTVICDIISGQTVFPQCRKFAEEFSQQIFAQRLVSLIAAATAD